MTHLVQGFIYEARWSASFPRLTSNSTKAPLAQSFELMLEPEYELDPDVGPTSPLHEFGVKGSMIVPVAFFNTEYTGAEGDQAACVWRAGRVIEPFKWGDDIINRALRHLGVNRDPRWPDEYAAVGLGWYRHHEDWIEFAANGSAAWQREPSPDAHKAWLEWRGSKT